ILSLLGWIVAVVAANLFGPELALHLPDKIPGEAIKLLVAYAIIMVATVLLMAVVNMLIATILAATGLKLADKGLGGLFG
ncbi:CvpA family protein, partial [Acinetobacter baumannii]